MPVVIEGLTVVVRQQTLAQKWPGGLAGFIARPPECRRVDEGRLFAFTTRTKRGPKPSQSQRTLEAVLQRHALGSAAVVQRSARSAAGAGRRRPA